MRMKGDITDVSPLIDDSHLFMVNDLIFTSAGIMMWDPEIKVGEKGGGSGVNGEWEHGDNVEW